MNLVNMLGSFKLAAALTLATGILGQAPAQAQGFSVNFGKHTKHGHFEVSIGGPAGGYGQPAWHRAPKKTWVSGHFETRWEQVWVPGACRKIWHEPVYELRTTYCGQTYKVLIQDGWWETNQEPGHFQQVQRKVWVNGYWQQC
jgi:hypothetical protein